MEKVNIKTSYNRMTFLVALLISNIGLLGLAAAFFLDGYKVIQLCCVIVSVVWIITCEFVVIREILTYEELKDDVIIVSRVFSKKQLEVKNISKVVLADRLVYLIDYAGRKFCKLDPTRENVNKLVDALIEKEITKEYNK